LLPETNACNQTSQLNHRTYRPNHMVAMITDVRKPSDKASARSDHIRIRS